MDSIMDAVKEGRLSYKQIVEEMMETNPRKTTEIAQRLEKSKDDPELVAKKDRAKHRKEKKEELGDDPDALKEAMKEYDGEHKPKTKRSAPPPPNKGPLSPEEKVRRAGTALAKKNHIAAETEKLGGAKATVGDVEKMKKAYNAKVAKEKKEAREKKAEQKKAEDEPKEDETKKAEEPKENEQKKAKKTKKKADEPKKKADEPKEEPNAESEEEAWD